jgi:type II secretory pathway pseudopilin PulG
MVELLIVMVLGAIMVTVAMPRLDLRRFRIDAAVRAANLAMLGAQRLAIQKQHNVVVAFDTVQNLIRIHQDSDNDGVMEPGELVRQRPLGEGVRFGLGGATARAIGGASVTFIRSQAGLPAVTFSRAGTGSEIGGFYVSSTNSGSPGVRVDTRAFEVERATGRTERFRWEPTANTWTRAF